MVLLFFAFFPSFSFFNFFFLSRFENAWKRGIRGFGDILQFIGIL